MYYFLGRLVLFLPLIILIIIAVLIIHRRSVKLKRFQQENERAVLERIIDTLDHNPERLNTSQHSERPQDNTQAQNIKMSCSKCGSPMEIDESQRIAFCRYCGMKEILAESDYVKEARINAEMNEKIAEEKRQAAKELYQQYHDTLRIQNKERRKNELVKALKNILGLLCGLAIVVLLVWGAIKGIGLLIDYLASKGPDYFLEVQKKLK